MTVNEREQKCYDGSLRAMQKSGGLRTLRDEEGIRFSAEILDNTIRRRSVIIIRPNSTSLISYSRRKILDCNRFQALSFPVYIRARPYFDNINDSHEFVQFHDSRDVRNLATREYSMSKTPFEFRPVVTSTKQRRHTSRITYRFPDVFR